MTTLRTRVALVAVPGLLLLGACAGGPHAASQTRSADSGGATAREVAPGASSGGEAGTGAGTGKAASAAVLGRAVVATGEISLRARSLADARAEVLRLATRWGGLVADERTESDDRGRVRSSSLTLRVPTPRFGEALDALGRLGEVEHTSRSTEDVTTQVIDNAARVRAAQRSIRQVERLLDRATQLSDVITVESDLARRQADLDSLERQQAWLDDQTSLSTIDVQLHRLVATRPAPAAATGFLAGLADGWHALGASTVAVLQVVGALLPFALLLLVLGVPVALLVRRVSARSTPGRTP